MGETIKKNLTKRIKNSKVTLVFSVPLIAAVVF